MMRLLSDNIWGDDVDDPRACRHQEDDDGDNNIIIKAVVDGNNLRADAGNLSSLREKDAAEVRDDENDDATVSTNDDDPVCCHVDDDDPLQQQYRKRPGRQMAATWCLGIMMPCAVAAWYQTAGQLWITMAATFAAPALAIIQGAMGILTYRVFYGDAPIPASPSHGVVVVRPGPSSESTTSATTVVDEDEEVDEDNIDDDDDDTYLNKVLERPPIRLLVVGDSLAVGVGQSGQATPVMPEVIAKTISKNTGRVVYWTCHGAPGASAGWIIRELERGVEYRGNGDIEEEDEEEEEEEFDDEDYQLVNASPNTTTSEDEEEQGTATVTIEAQSTCSETDESSSTCSSDEDTATHLPPGSPRNNNSNMAAADASLASARSASNSPVQSANSRLNSNERRRTTATSMTILSSARNRRAKRRAWRERLAQHKKRFDNPDLLGPYDIAVVLTGSNDLKSAFFPFLLTGEDREFRRQAQQRGGSYATDLRLVRDTLNSKMQRSIEQFRHRVEHAAEHAFERMAEQIPLMLSPTGSSSGHHQEQQPQRNRSRSDSIGSRRIRRGSTPMTQKEQEQLLLPLRRRIHSETTATAGSADYGATTVNNKSTAAVYYSRSTAAGADITPTNHHPHQQHFPLVVFPGMPARALPIFRCRPLRWLAIPIVDIMDMHKRRLAAQHPGQVLFVRAPTPTGVIQYEKKVGAYWSQRCEEKTLLELRDIKKRDRRRIESEMHDYYRRHHLDGGSDGDQGRHPSTNVNDDIGRGADAATGDRSEGGWRTWARSFCFFASSRTTSSSSSSSPQQPAKCFSVDQIHPTDDGYDFWGRHIGRAIVDEKQWMSGGGAVNHQNSTE